MATLALRLFHLDQPIVENYVGRQTPTAMVARNLDRGSGFLRPTLDTGPHPNLFLVEPPVYASMAVGVRRVTGLRLEPAGRLVSALMTTLGVWGLYGLIRRREGFIAAIAAAVAFAAFPITVRYGRAFQPDAAMMGAALAGMRCWDEGRRPWMVAGWLLMGLGLSLKITSAYLLIPLLSISDRRPRSLILGASMLVPALLWYAEVYAVLGPMSASRAAADGARLWRGAIDVAALGKPGAPTLYGRFLLVRAFTPLGFGLAAYGFARGVDRLWWTWLGSALASMAVLAGKLHHEYYWFALAPPAAAGVGRALAELSARGVIGRGAAAMLAVSLVGLGLYQSRATWASPPEWEGLTDSANIIRKLVPVDAPLVAPEALLYAADRRGCRLEWTPGAVARAAGEWGAEARDDPRDLIEFYRRHGARFAADLRGEDPRRRLIAPYLRTHHRVLVDDGRLILAELVAPEPHADARP